MGNNQMGLICSRNEGETWRKCAERYAAEYGLQYEVLEVFDTEIESGTPEDEACWIALYEWDCLDYRESE